MRKMTLLACLAAVTALGAAKPDDKRLDNAAAVFREIMKTPDRSIPQDLLQRAACIVIIPGLKKGAFGFGGKYGRGFASCRRSGGGWGSPAGIRIEGGSFGFQLGGSSTDVVMLVMNERGMGRLLSDKFTLGGEASAAAGPVGRNAAANTDVLVTAEILSWSRSRGLFAGLSLEGSTLRPDQDENEKMYGKDVRNQDILQGKTGTPKSAAGLVAALNKYSMRGGHPKKR